MQTIQLPASIQERLRPLFIQQQALQARVADILSTALEAMGIEGTATNYNVNTGQITVMEQPAQASPDGVAAEVPPEVFSASPRRAKRR